MIVGQEGEPPLRRVGNAPFAPLCPPGFLGVPVIVGHPRRYSPWMTHNPGLDPAAAAILQMTRATAKTADANPSHH